MSAITNTNYKEAESPYEGKVRLYISRTYSVEIDIEDDDENKETFRCSLSPLFTFMKQRLKNVDWKHISRTRKAKWGYKRIEPEELFDLLSRN